MGWQTRIASFRGVEFHVNQTSETFGRRVVAHEYPQRDEPFTEDMGRKAREFSVEGFVIGLDYESQRDKLTDEVEKEGAGQLVHPYYGTRIVTVTSCKVTHSSDRGGMATFSFSFLEAGQQVEPAVSIDSGAQLHDMQTSALGAAREDFLAGFSLDGLPSWGVEDIQKTILSFLPLDTIFGAIEEVGAFRSRIAALIRTPAALADALFGVIARFTDVRDLLEIPFVQNNTTGGVQSVGGKVRQQQALVTVAVRRAALIQHAGNLAFGNYATVQEVQGARASVVEAFDSHDYARGNPRPSPTLAAQFRQLKATALSHMNTLAVTLPRTYEKTLLEPLPAIVVSYEVYGELRQQDIVTRNGIRHPGFMPAGIPLQLTTT